MRTIRIIFMTAALALTLFLSACLPFGEGGGGKAVKSASEPLNDEVKAQVDQATDLLKRGNASEALPLLMAAKREAPKNADVDNYIGLTHYTLKDYEPAISSFKSALELDSKRTDVRNNLGLVYLAQQDYERALAEFNLCLKDQTYQKPQLPLNNIGQTYLEMGRYDEAAAALVRATEVAPEYDRSYTRLGRVYLAQREYQQALDALENAERLTPGRPENCGLLREAHLGLGNSQAAASVCGGSAM